MCPESKQSGASDGLAPGGVLGVCCPVPLTCSTKPASETDHAQVFIPANGVVLGDTLHDLSTCALRIESYWQT